MPDLNHYLLGQIVLAEDFPSYKVLDNHNNALQPKRLEGLAKINVFVGANNSGKSRLIRGIAKAKTIVFEPPDDSFLLGAPFREIRQFAEKLVNKKIWPSNWTVDYLVTRLGIANYADHSSQANIQGLVTEFKDANSMLRVAYSWFKPLLENAIENTKGQALQEANKIFKDVQANYERALDIESAARKIQRVYIPTLRTMRELGNKELLTSRTSHDYQIDSKDIFTGQTLYTDVERLLRGNLTDRDNLRDFEKWIGEIFFDGRSVALIPRHDQTTLTVKIGDEPEKAIHELGDGIQSLLILTFPLFRAKDQHVLAFIEEPELFLHPWLQRVFLETLSKRFPKHQYFLTTHSNHFLDLTLDVDDVSVYTLEKHLDRTAGAREARVNFHVQQVSRDQRRPLELLGVRNSSVLLSNCTIWVEGVTDRRYIAQWLKLYQEHLHSTGSAVKNLKEDFHYSFVEYGGGNITHFSFLDDEEEEETSEKRILVNTLCSKLFLITDSDIDPERPKRSSKAVKAENETTSAGEELQCSDPKKSRKALLEKRLEDRYHCLESREIENLLSPKVLRDVLISYGEDNPPEFDQNKYRTARLGEFIDKQLGTSRLRKGKYGGDYGVLNGKVTFCSKAVAATLSWEDLSPEAQNLVKKIHNFISSMNTDAV